MAKYLDDGQSDSKRGTLSFTLPYISLPAVRENRTQVHRYYQELTWVKGETITEKQKDFQESEHAKTLQSTISNIKNRVDDMKVTMEQTFRKFQERVCVPPNQAEIDLLLQKSYDTTNIPWEQLNN